MSVGSYLVDAGNVHEFDPAEHGYAFPVNEVLPTSPSYLTMRLAFRSHLFNSEQYSFYIKENIREYHINPSFL